MSASTQVSNIRSYLSFGLVLCWEANMQFGSGSGYFRWIRVGSNRVESCNMNKKLLIFLLWTLTWINQQIEQNEDLYSAYRKTSITTIFWLNLWLKKLPTFDIFKICNTRHGTGPNRGPITRPTQDIDTSLIWMMVAKMSLGTVALYVSRIIISMSNVTRDRLATSMYFRILTGMTVRWAHHALVLTLPVQL